MSLGLVFGATDGVLVVADGRNSRKVWPAGTLEPRSDETLKVAVAQTVPVAVVATGKSHLRQSDGASQPVARLIEDFLGEHSSVWRNSPNPEERVVKGVAEYIDGALRQDRAVRLGVPIDQVDDIPLTEIDLLDELEILIAGCLSEGSRAAVHRLTVTHRELTYGPEPGFPQRPMATVPHRPLAHMGSDEHSGMPADLVEAYFDRSAEVLDAMEDNADYDLEALDAAYLLRDLPLTELHVEVLDGLQKIIEGAPAAFEKYGVGGRWTVVEMRCDRPSERSWADLGPRMPPVWTNANS